MDTSTLYDLIIIGAGPAGLAASIYALERKLKTLVVESHSPGGQLVTLYGDKPIYDYPSYPSIVAKELAQKMVEHARSSGVELSEHVTVQHVTPQNGQFIVSCNNCSLNTKSVLIASGMRQFLPQRLGIPGETELFNRGVIYQKLPSETLQGASVIVVGGGDVALETALSAFEKGARVTLVHRRNEFRAQEKTVEKLAGTSIVVHKPATLTRVNGTSHVESVDIADEKGIATTLSCTYLIICAGVSMSDSFFSELGLKIERQALVIDSDMQTTVSGIFACGDVTVPAGKYKRISIAVGGAAVAINGVYFYVKSVSRKQSQSNT